MQSLKTKSIQHRIKQGNIRSRFVMDYLNNNSVINDWQETSLKEDMYEGKDIYSPSTKLTAQIKVRDSGLDFIFESHKFIPGTPFTFKDGRDVKTCADFYICCRPKINEILITKTCNIKHSLKQIYNKFNATMDNEFAIKNWAKAMSTYNKSIVLYTDDSAQIHFKIDEGSNTNPYAKLICYLKPSAIKNMHSIKLENENIMNKDTWKNDNIRLDKKIWD